MVLKPNAESTRNEEGNINYVHYHLPDHDVGMFVFLAELQITEEDMKAMTWKKTTCVMCGLCCGLEVQVEKNRIVKVRPDKQSPISEGYICRKGMNIAYHEHNSDRLLYPMKKVGGKFERISWDQAIGEIAEKLKPILQAHGPRSLASVTGGGEYNFYTSRFPSGFVQALGSRYLYSSANQEFAGRYWAHGLTLGSQMLEIPPDYVHSDMFLTVGWNGMMSHGIPQTRKVLPRFAKDPDKLLVAIDPQVLRDGKSRKHPPGPAARHGCPAFEIDDCHYHQRWYA